jgi:hypothetical protein
MAEAVTDHVGAGDARDPIRAAGLP